MLKSNILIALTVIGIAAWHLLTIRAGHDWGDDFSLYVHHAKNIVEGRPYADTGYIYNPSLSVLSPRSYPPVFPLLLTPIYAIFGQNLNAMKALVVVLLALFLLVTYSAARRELSFKSALALIVLVGLNPYVWQHKDRLLSEIPFLLCVALCFWLFNRIDVATGPRRWGLALLGGVCLYLAYGTRTVGAVLPIALILSNLVRFRRVQLSTIIALGVFAVGVATQTMLSSDGSYFDQFVFSPALFASNFVSLVKAMGLFVDNGFSDTARSVLFLSLAGLSAVGYLSCLCRKAVPRDFFGPLYFVLIVVWPASSWDQRFLLPLLPLFFLYVLHGIVFLRERAHSIAIPLAALPALVLASYLALYTKFDFGPQREGVTKAESVEFFEYVKNSTKRDAVFIFQKPRALALLTDRHAAALHIPRSDAEFWAYLNEVNATHLVVCRVFRENAAVLQPFVERQGDRLREEFRNADFVVYRLESVAGTQTALKP